MATMEHDKYEHARENARIWYSSIEEMIDSLYLLNDSDGKTLDSAETAIRKSVLSVLVRDGWRLPGAPSEDSPEEYEILLTTGGPALRIYGKLNQHSEPETAELQMQDWYISWERWPDADENVLLAFASCFYFGE